MTTVFVPSTAGRRYPLAASVIVTFAALLGACSSDDSATRFFPLEAGRSWQYRLERTTMDGTSELRYAIATLAPPTGIGGIRETVNGYRYLYAIEEDGIYRIGEHARSRAVDLDQQERQIVMPHDLALKSSWRATSRTSVLENGGPPWETLFRIDVPVEMHYAVESLDGEVTTPAGRFSGCLVVTGHGQVNADIGSFLGASDVEISSREWFAPGVGLVRMERHESTSASALSAGSMTMELDAWRD